MKERPMLFKGEMVRATLDGRKTQTRRVVKPQPVFTAATGDSFEWQGGKALQAAGYGDRYVHSDWVAVERAMLAVCPHGQPGDKLWVKETFRISTWNDCACYEPCSCKIGVPIYRATYGYGDDEDKWKPSIFMRRVDSRITLEIVSVRVERLQEITEEDAKAEGVERREHFIRLWDSINSGTFTFDVNPFVWVVEFRRIIP